MISDPDPLLNRLVVAALTVFVMVSLLMAAFVSREIWLQQRITGLSTSVQGNLEDLEATTEQIQSQLNEIRVTPGAVQEPESQVELTRQATNLEDITELLEDVDAQLDSIEKEIGDVALMVEPESAGADAVEREEDTTAPDRIDQVFTIFAALIGIAGIAIAVLLGMAVHVQQRISWGESRYL